MSKKSQRYKRLMLQEKKRADSVEACARKSVIDAFRGERMMSVTVELTTGQKFEFPVSVLTRCDTDSGVKLTFRALVK